MHCTHCGASIAAEARFCARCGKPQGTEATATTTIAQAPAPMATATFPSAASFNALPDARDVPSNGRTPLIVGGLAVLAVALGGFGYWGWEKRQEADEAARKVTEMERAAALMQKQNAQATRVAQTASEQASRAAEETERLAIAVAQAALDKAIVEEETQARARLASATR